MTVRQVDLEQEAAEATRLPVEAANQQNCGELAGLPRFLTADEVARLLLRTTRKAVYIMAERGLLPGVTRIGRRILFRTDVLLDWLHQKAAPSPKE
jgi:excisionase family DNA binding protein